MNEKNWRENCFLFGMIAVIQYVILTSIAMLFYTGGTMVNPYVLDYSFWTNFFSDLGRTKAWSGRDNTISMILFIIAASIYGISLILSFIALPYFFRENNLEKWLSNIGSVFGILYGILIVGIAFTPWDIYYDEHMIIVQISQIISLILGIAYVIVLLHNKEFPNRYAITWIVALAAGVIFSVILNVYGVWPPRNMDQLMLFTASQKITSYIALACIIYISYGAWKQIKS